MSEKFLDDTGLEYYTSRLLEQITDNFKVFDDPSMIDLSSHLTVHAAEETYQKKTDALTEDDVREIAPETVINAGSGIKVTQHDVNTYTIATSGDGTAGLADYYTKNKADELFATKYYVQEEIVRAQSGQNDIDLSAYAKKTDIPKNISDLEGHDDLVTRDSLNSYAKKDEIPKNISDLEGHDNLVTTDDIDGYYVKPDEGIAGISWTDISLIAGAQIDFSAPEVTFNGDLIATEEYVNESIANISSENIAINPSNLNKLYSMTGLFADNFTDNYTSNKGYAPLYTDRYIVNGYSDLNLLVDKDGYAYKYGTLFDQYLITRYDGTNAIITVSSTLPEAYNGESVYDIGFIDEPKNQSSMQMKFTYGNVSTDITIPAEAVDRWIYIKVSNSTPDLVAKEEALKNILPSYVEINKFSIKRPTNHNLEGTLRQIDYDHTNNKTKLILDTSTNYFTKEAKSSISIYFPYQPYAGNIDQSLDNVDVAGIGNIAGHFGTAVTGYKNEVISNYGSARGRYNIAGYDADASGQYNEASGESSHVEGNSNKATASYAHAQNNKNTASGIASSAAGEETLASGRGSATFGQFTKASGKYSFAVGMGAKDQSTGIITYNTASGQGSAAFGCNNTALGAYSFVTGTENIVSATNSSAYGKGNEVKGAQSVAIGNTNIIKETGTNSLISGQNNSSEQTYSFIAGCDNTITKASNNDQYSFTIGYNNTISGAGSGALGNNNIVSGSQNLAVGNANTVSNQYNFVCGYGCTASHTYSICGGRSNTTSAAYTVAFGYNNNSTGEGAITFGNTNTASGAGSCCIGKNNTATVNRATAIGESNSATHKQSVVFGKGNKSCAENSLVIGDYNNPVNNHLFEIGNGTADAPKNVFTVSTLGDVTASGNITASGDVKISGTLTAKDYNYTGDNYFDFTGQNYKIANKKGLYLVEIACREGLTGSAALCWTLGGNTYTVCTITDGSDMAVMRVSMSPELVSLAQISGPKAIDLANCSVRVFKLGSYIPSSGGN